MINLNDPRYRSKKAKKTVEKPKPKKANKDLAKKMKSGGRKVIG